ncbi:MAG: flavodoxin-dependent (E)-4-hydroxy-3-methylbut-2-enyl-diphosphate synthase [Candidatus Omnitrophica bacterium]|nr:flavodoxin-dependent (E)-4-hydroxy-3-methylbut-2-enyl-diphosphate synthase [Candidatus Omnitrophota bacterium]
MKRRKARIVKIGNIGIGGDYPVAIQSMTKCKTADIPDALRQIKELAALGCDIVRLAIKDSGDAEALRKIKERINMPLVADIHFDWRLALKAIEAGADKVRLNPGNIYKKEQIREIAYAAALKKIPIRVGLNSGSLPPRKAQVKDIAGGMVKSAMDYIKILERYDFRNIVISLKASNIADTVNAYRKISRLCDYPLHLGVTATGTAGTGVIKSAIAIGALLLEGIGDTIRISLTAKPGEEVRAAKCILEALSLRRFGPEIISCPTCGRCEIDLVKVVKELESRLSGIDNRKFSRPVKLAVMGCLVNGPGEAKEADIAVAFGAKDGLLFKNGKPVRKISLSGCSAALLKELKSFLH